MRIAIAPIAAAAALTWSSTAFAAPQALEGWKVHPTTYTYTALIERVKAATKANGMGVVTQAGPTGAAKSRGITIPGNRVIGVFNNKFAVEMLGVSENAMIEAPVRFYVTEEPDGTATLSYKTPNHVFAPYVPNAPAVAGIAQRLTDKFATIAADAIK
ncbi:MAG: DUF302 domain-containing protein [Pikeienuella sp.]